MKKNDILEDIDPKETKEWLDAIQSVINLDGIERAQYLLDRLIQNTGEVGALKSVNTSGIPSINTPYLNTIPKSQEKEYPVILR